MKVGLFINTQFPEGFNLAERVPEMVAQVRAARDAGFASLWFPHHWLTHPMQMLQITPVMGYVAAHAQGMTIGPNILILPPLNPTHVAEEAATLDVLTGGNYILGIGLGYRQPEFDAFGIGLSERAPRFNESITLMRRLWTEDRVSHQGRFYTVNDAFQYASYLHRPFATGMFMLWDRQKFWELGGFHEQILFAEDYRLSQQVERKRFGIVRGGVYTTNRRFKRMGHRRVGWLFLKTAMNYWNEKYFFRDHKYWAEPEPHA